MKIKKEIRSIVKSFNFAFKGLWFCIVNERNMRIHLVVAAYVLLFSLFYNLSRLEYIVLLFAIALVIISEMINTAIETLTNLSSPSYDMLAKLSKDIAAAAVFIAALFAVVIGTILFFDLSVFSNILAFFTENLLNVVALILSLILSCIFVAKGFLPVKRSRQNIVRRIRDSQERKGD